MKTYPVNHHLLASSAETLARLDHFAWYVDTLAECIHQSASQQNYALIECLADMLTQLATDAQNHEGAQLSADLCHIMDANLITTKS
ncbi:hypothetical protein PT286_03125 [Neisseriaceae bacterium ESL0693]|nr:hypothetical protein [Neisseriaceae bacterium ESL0693]